MANPWQQGILICITGALTGLVVIGGIYFFFFKASPDKGKILASYGQPVSVMKVPEPPQVHAITLSGVVQSTATAPIKAAIGGHVIKVLAQNKATLAKGDPILQIDDSPLEKTYQDLETELGMAQAQLQLAMMSSIQSMPKMPTASIKQDNITATQVDQHAGVLKITRYNEQATESTSKSLPSPPKTSPTKDTSKTTPDKASESKESDPNAQADASDATESPEIQKDKAVFNALLAKMQTLQKAMADYTIRMPQAGQLTDFNAKVNDFILPDTIIGQIKTTSYPDIKAQLAQDLLTSLKVGQSVTIKDAKNDLNNTPITGQIEAIQPLDTITNNIGWILVSPLQGDPGRFTSGQTVNITIQVAGEGNIWISTDAVQSRNTHSVVFVVHQSKDKTWTTEERQVTIGDTFKTDTEIKAGLKPGETIVLDGANLLQNMQNVTIIGSDSLDP